MLGFTNEIVIYIFEMFFDCFFFLILILGILFYLEAYKKNLLGGAVLQINEINLNPV